MIAGPDFLALQKLLQDRCGMALTSDKLYLVGSRLGPVAQTLGLHSVMELLRELRERPRESTIMAVIEAMVTHESLFFRDARPFEQLAVALSDLNRKRPVGKAIRIWSAACSSGQEPYSIAMQIQESQPHAGGRRWEILGTDISESILKRARDGRYSAFEARRGLSAERIARHLEPLDEQTFIVRNPLRRMVQFCTHNLLEPAAHLGAFDVVFCRNVLIYFDAPTKKKALDLIARQLAPDGYLFLGGADSILGLTDKFIGAMQDRGLYRLVQGATALAG